MSVRSNMYECGFACVCEVCVNVCIRVYEYVCGCVNVCVGCKCVDVLMCVWVCEYMCGYVNMCVFVCLNNSSLY